MPGFSLAVQCGAIYIAMPVNISQFMTPHSPVLKGCRQYSLPFLRVLGESFYCLLRLEMMTGCSMIQLLAYTYVDTSLLIVPGVPITFQKAAILGASLDAAFPFCSPIVCWHFLKDGP